MHLPPLLIVGLGVMLDIGAAILCIMAQFAQSDKVKNESCRQAIIEVVETHWEIGMSLLVIGHVYGGIVAFLCLTMWQDSMHGIMKTYAKFFVVISCLTFVMGVVPLVVGRKLRESSDGSCAITHPHFLVFGGLVCFVHGVLTLFGYLTTIRCIQEKLGDASENANYTYKGHYSTSP